MILFQATLSITFEFQVDFKVCVLMPFVRADMLVLVCAHYFVVVIVPVFL